MNKSKIEQSMEWRDINWKEISGYVEKLQTKIYQASKSGNVKRMRQLQHTLARSYRARLLAVRKVSQDNSGKKTAGVDGIASINPQQRLALAEKLRFDGKARPVRRVQILKPNGKPRDLGIPVMEDRAKQCLAKLAVLEPQWEAKFSGSSYGFRPGRSCHDAIEEIFKSINTSGHNKIILDADISKCFDEIDHDYLLNKLETYPGLKRQVKAWLKAGVQVGFGHKELQSTERGTPQGGVISPLLANIALDALDKWVESIQHQHSGHKSQKWIKIVRYADDFVLLINTELYLRKGQKSSDEQMETLKTSKLNDVNRILKDIGLKISEEKTKWTTPKEGFDFLGFNVRQYKVGNYRSAKKSNKQILGYKTLIKPSKEKVLKHYHKLAEIIRTHQNAPKEALVAKLNPIIRGWCNYYKHQVSSKTFSKLDHMVHRRIMRMLSRKHKCGKKEIYRKCFHREGNRKWCYGNLIKHADTDIERHTKIKGEESPFDGNKVYWAKRAHKYSGLTKRQQYLFKQQKGICAWCNGRFTNDDLNKMDVDHITPTSLGGTNDWKNLQLLHRHCHDSKTAQDGSLKKRRPNTLGNVSGKKPKPNTLGNVSGKKPTSKIKKQNPKQDVSWDNNPW